MSLPKIRLEDSHKIGPGLWRPDEATLNHLTRSLRLYEGASLEGLSSSEGKKFFMKLVREDGEYLLRVTDEAGESADAVRVTLVVGLLKQDQFDTLLRTCAELGVNEIIPLICERSVPRFSQDEITKKMLRWNKILAEATKVSGSIHPPDLREPLKFSAFDWARLPEARFAALLSKETKPISSIPLRSGTLAIAVGPEGDWSDAEAETLLRNDFKPISLGRRILRASTAAIATVSYIRMSS